MNAADPHSRRSTSSATTREISPAIRDVTAPLPEEKVLDFGREMAARLAQLEQEFASFVTIDSHRVSLGR